METKHTPGPWKLIEQGDANMYGMVTAGNRWIISFQQNGELMSETQLANAKLMSVAPELLETLELLLSDVKQLLGDHDIEFHNSGSIIESENVIKKAKLI